MTPSEAVEEEVVAVTEAEDSCPPASGRVMVDMEEVSDRDVMRGIMGGLWAPVTASPSSRGSRCELDSEMEGSISLSLCIIVVF